MRGSLRRRMLLAVSVPFVAVVVLTAVTFLVRQYALDTREISIRALQNELALEQLGSVSQAAQLAALSYRQTGDQRWLDEFAEAVAERSSAEARLDNRLADRPMAQVRKAVDEHDARLRSLVDGDPAEGEGARLAAAARTEQQQLAVVLDRVTREEGKRFRSAREAADRLNAVITAAVVLIGAVGLVGGLVAVWFLSRGVVGRLARLQANAQRLGADQVLLPEPGGDDEIGALARTIETAHVSIREKDDLLDLALEAGGMVIFQVRPDNQITLRGEPALLGAVGLEGPAVTTSLDLLREYLSPGEDNTVSRLPNGDFRVVTREGDTRWLEVRSRQEPAEEGHEAGTVVGVVADVTARVEAQSALESAKELAEQANRSKDDFLSRMSHELRTPLNAVLGFAQLLDMGDLDHEQRESVDHILKGGRHLLALVNDVLDLARIESGRLSLSVEPTRLVDVVDEAIQLTRPLARQHRVDLITSGAGGAVHAMVDRRRMKQVLINLVSNGIKYNRPGGRVEVDWKVADGRVLLTVRDTGIGIAATQRDDLFLPFARSDERTAEIEGSGLGLAVSRSLVEAMGGRLTLGETGESGSTFVVEMPDAGDGVALLAAEGAGGSAVEQLRALGPLSVLHVEDNEANRRLVEELLRVAGTPRPVVATHGHQAMDLARRHRPDLVLLDRHLPDMLGEDVLRELSADTQTAGIPVIVVSADAMEKSASIFRSMGADAFVAKPIDAEEFWRTISTVLTDRGGMS
ncbi:ATP-binding protein [Nocardioides gansuensis]|nr:ATP-binding protein [Nocardioides gansuensis]